MKGIEIKPPVQHGEWYRHGSQLAENALFEGARLSTLNFVYFARTKSDRALSR